MSQADNQPAAPATAPASTAQNQAAAQADPKLTHVAVQWKHSSPLISCRFDPLGRYVFACAEDATIQRWDLSSANQVALRGHQSWPRGIAFSDDGQTLITSGYDDTLIWWPATAEQPQPLRTVRAHNGWIRTLSTSPDGRLLASGGNDNLVKIWNLHDGTLVGELAGHQKHVYSTLFHPSGQYLLSGDLAGQVKQWETSSGKLVRTFDAKALHTFHSGQGVDYGGVRSLALSPDGKFLACAGLHKATNPLGAVNEPLVVLFDWQSQEVVKSLVASGVRGIAWRVLFHPEGFLIGASGGSGGGFLLFWKTDQDKEFHKLKLPNTARGMDLHPDGIQLATVHYDSHLRISKMIQK